MNPVFICFLIISLCLFSCGRVKDDGVPEIEITHRNPEGDLTSLVKSFEITPLENPPGAYLRSVGRSIFTDSLIFIGNTRGRNILVYTKSGEFLDTIGKAGKGPGEIASLHDFTFNYEDSTVTAFDRHKKINYSLTGEVLNEEKLEFSVNRVIRMKSGNLLFERFSPEGNPENDYYLRLADGEMNTIDAILPIPVPDFPNISLRGQIYRAQLKNDHALYFSHLGDTIYQIDKDSIYPLFALSYDKKTDILGDASQPIDLSSAEDIYSFISYYKTDNFSMLFFMHLHDWYCNVFDHETGNATVFRTDFNINSVHNNKAMILVNSIDLPYFIDEVFEPAGISCTNPEVLENVLGNYEEGIFTFLKLEFHPFNTDG